MKNYEGMFILKARLSEEDRKSEIEWITSTIENSQGKVVKVDEWGRRKLAYEIKRAYEGFYVLFFITMDGDIVKKIRRLFNIRENILRFLIVVQEGQVEMKAEPALEE